MRGLSQLAAGHQALVDFWADYEVRRRRQGHWGWGGVSAGLAVTLGLRMGCTTFFLQPPQCTCSSGQTMR
jgi:hypothetical protein